MVEVYHDDSCDLCDMPGNIDDMIQVEGDFGLILIYCKPCAEKYEIIEENTEIKQTILQELAK